METDAAACRFSPLLEGLIGLAHAAGAAILAVAARGGEARLKADRSPVTDADTAAEAVILAGLARLAPAVPVIAEEQAAAGVMPAVGSEFFLVDPLDGTREFLSGNGEYTVNIALVRGGVPVAGVVYAPARARLYAGEAGAGAAAAVLAADGDLAAADWRRLRPRAPGRPLRVVASRSHRDAETDAWLARLGEADIVAAGSSLKFCLLAAGEADLYPRFGPTMEWDTAAGHAVLAAAGGSVDTVDGYPLAYGKAEAGFMNPAFIASAGQGPGKD